MTDNLRYVGDVFIDGKTDILLREFLTNLFNQYNGEGKGFNADMLDGHHYSEIEFALNVLEDTKLSEITIGGSVFNADNPGAFLHFSDVVHDGEPEEWMDNHNYSTYNITNALNDLYDDLINKKLVLKVDKEKVDPSDVSDNPRMKVLSDNNFDDQYKSNLDDLSGLLEDFVDYEDANGVIHHFLSADLTNGLRFILITQDDYDALETDVKNYWRNVFIIKESVPTALDYHSPLEFDLKDGYDFRVAQDDEPISDFIINDDGTDRPYWIQLKHTWSNTWSNLMPLQNFLLGANLRGEIINVLENDENLEYNEISIKNVLLKLLTDSTETNFINLPYLSLNDKNQFIHRILKDGVELETIDSDGFSNVDISNAFSTEFTNIDDRINAISNTDGTGKLDIQMSELNSTVTQLDTQINGTQESSISKQLSSINNSIGNIRDDVANIKAITQNVNNWKAYTIPNIGTNYYNEALKVAYLSFGFNHYFNTKTDYQTGRSDSSYYKPQRNAKLNPYAYTTVKAKPVGVVNAINDTHPFDTILNINSSGRIGAMVYNKDTSPGHAWFGGMSPIYRYSSLYSDAELEAMKNR